MESTTKWSMQSFSIWSSCVNNFKNKKISLESGRFWGIAECDFLWYYGYMLYILCRYGFVENWKGNLLRLSSSLDDENWRRYHQNTGGIIIYAAPDMCIPVAPSVSNVMYVYSRGTLKIYGDMIIYIWKHMTIHDNTYQHMNSRILGFSGVYVARIICIPIYCHVFFIYIYDHTTTYTPEKPRILEFVYWHVSGLETCKVVTITVTSHGQTWPWPWLVTVIVIVTKNHGHTYL